MAGGPGNMALGGGDPRLSINGDEKYGRLGGEGITAYTRVQMLAIRDPNVTLEEYNYYANICRAEEDASAIGEAKLGIKQMLFPSKKNDNLSYPARRDSTTIGMSSDDKEAITSGRSAVGGVNVSDEEWINAQRAVRQASGAACFYLITTDILGPFSLPYSFATTGWGPGITLFTLFAVFAGYSGYMLNKMFCGTDSYRYPTRSYGDVAYRIYGQWGRIPVNILQGIQLILSVAIITVTNGQSLSVITKFHLCYVVCIVILVACGMVVGQVRTLQKFGWLANFAVFINVFIMIWTMAIAATSGPNLGAAQSLSAGVALGDGSTTPDPITGVFPPVQHHGGLPVTGNFIGSLNGITNAVYAYGGANVFNEFMAEMKRPKDFLRAMWAAQFFIWFVYMFYGLFLYGYQGQYTVNPSPLTISPYWGLVVSSLLYIITGAIAAVLYGNIGLKVIYNNILVEIFHLPPLTARGGKILWIFLIPIYWAIAFVIGAAIPNFGALVGVVASICIIQFTYSLPPIFYIGYKVRLNALQQGEGYDPATNTVIKHDRGMKRFVRGLTSGSRLDKAMMAWNFIYAPAALALAGLGAYASITGIIDTFKGGSVNAFSCTSPLDGQVFGGP